MFMVIGYANGPALWVYFPQLNRKVTIPTPASYNMLIQGHGFGGHFEMSRDDLEAIPYLRTNQPGG